MSGVPQLDTFGMFAMHLMRDREISPERIAELFSHFPGRFLGRKIGKIEPGYEASFTVLKEGCKEVTKGMLKTKCRWSPFEGIYLPGSVAGVIYRKILG
jgi:dihydroorotase-like cyclic amidohydrolase